MEETEKITDAAFDMALTARSSVKITKSSKGVNWDIKVVVGEEKLIDALKAVALKAHREFEEEFA